MDRKSITAVMLMLLMCLAGCLGATEPATEITETPQEAYSLKTTWVVAPSEIQLGEQAVFMLGVQQEGPGAFTVDYTVLQADFHLSTPWIGLKTKPDTNSDSRHESRVNTLFQSSSPTREPRHSNRPSLRWSCP